MLSTAFRKDAVLFFVETNLCYARDIKDISISLL